MKTTADIAKADRAGLLRALRAAQLRVIRLKSDLALLEARSAAGAPHLVDRTKFGKSPAV